MCDNKTIMKIESDISLVNSIEYEYQIEIHIAFTLLCCGRHDVVKLSKFASNNQPIPIIVNFMFFIAYRTLECVALSQKKKQKHEKKTKNGLCNCEIEHMQICRTQYENQQFIAHFKPIK